MGKSHRIGDRWDDGTAFTLCGVRIHRPNGAGYFTLPDNTNTNLHSRRRSTEIEIVERGPTCGKCLTSGPNRQSSNIHRLR